MSKWIQCEICGDRKEVPAYPGDGVYHIHVCVKQDDEYDYSKKHKNNN